MPTPGGKLVRASIAARELGVSWWTIKRWVRDRKIAGTRIAGRWYVSRKALEALRETLEIAGSGIEPLHVGKGATLDASPPRKGRPPPDTKASS